MSWADGPASSRKIGTSSSRRGCTDVVLLHAPDRGTAGVRASGATRRGCTVHRPSPDGVDAPPRLAGPTQAAPDSIQRRLGTGGPSSSRSGPRRTGLPCRGYGVRGAAMRPRRAGLVSRNLGSTPGPGLRRRRPPMPRMPRPANTRRRRAPTPRRRAIRARAHSRAAAHRPVGPAHVAPRHRVVATRPATAPLSDNRCRLSTAALVAGRQNVRERESSKHRHPGSWRPARNPAAGTTAALVLIVPRALQRGHGTRILLDVLSRGGRQHVLPHPHRWQHALDQGSAFCLRRSRILDRYVRARSRPHRRILLACRGGDLSLLHDSLCVRCSRQACYRQTSKPDVPGRVGVDRGS